MAHQRPLVLLVEDDPDHIELIIESLQENGLSSQFVHVPDGQAALDYLFGVPGKIAPQPPPDLILLDLHLPKVDGLSVLKRIHASEQLRALPVIVLTTSSDSKDIEAAYQHGANSYLVKPFAFEQFCKMLKDLEHYWLGWNRRPE